MICLDKYVLLQRKTFIATSQTFVRLPHNLERGPRDKDTVSGQAPRWIIGETSEFYVHGTLLST